MQMGLPIYVTAYMDLTFFCSKLYLRYAEKRLGKKFTGKNFVLVIFKKSRDRKENYSAILVRLRSKAALTEV
jgi:hypothetical protein